MVHTVFKQEITLKANYIIDMMRWAIFGKRIKSDFQETRLLEKEIMKFLYLNWIWIESYIFYWGLYILHMLIKCLFRVLNIKVANNYR